MLDYLSKYSIFELVGVLITVAAFIYAIYCGKKSKRIKQFAYKRQCQRIISNGKEFLDGLKIEYNSTSISDLSISTFAIWNCGNETIISEVDMVEEAPITIKVDPNTDTKILDCKIIKCSEDTNKFSVSMSGDDRMELLFDYVEPQKGVLIHITHTGNAENLKFNYKIKGGKEAKEIDVLAQRNENKEKIWKKIGRVFIIVLDIAIIIMIAILDSINPEDYYISRNCMSYGQAVSELFLTKSVLSLVGIFEVLLSIRILFPRRNSKIPSEFRDVFFVGDR